MTVASENTFMARLRRGPLLGDGNMLTILHGNHDHRVIAEMENLNDPRMIIDIHKSYIEAGSEFIRTNTFRANRLKLSQLGSEAYISEINRTGVQAAQAAVAEASTEPGRAIFIAGTVGPSGLIPPPYGLLSERQLFDNFVEQIEFLVHSGVDVILLETFTDLAEIRGAIATARAVSAEIGVIASLTLDREDQTISGKSIAEAAKVLIEAGANVIGLNRGGASHFVRVAKIMREATDQPISVMFHAGFPNVQNGQVKYPASPDYLARYALALRNLGISIIGGDFGVRVDHIRAMRAALAMPANTISVNISASAKDKLLPEIQASFQPTPLLQKLRSDQFVFAVEVEPPRGINIDGFIAAAQLLKNANADAIHVSDSPVFRLRMNASVMCHLIQERVQIETILHFTVYGRNLMHIYADLFSASALRIRNLFVLAGDPTHVGDYPGDPIAKMVMPPSGVIKLIKGGLNQGKDHAANSIGKPTDFVVACALDVYAENMEKEVHTFRKKIEAGADFCVTQMVFDPARLHLMLTRYKQLYGAVEIPILVGILPLYGARQAKFLHNEFHGVVIPDPVQQYMRNAGDVAPEAGVEIACRMIRELNGVVQGVYLMPPFEHYEMAVDIIKALR